MSKPKIIVRKAISKKGTPYCSVVIDFGYRQVFMNSKQDNSYHLCAELLGISVNDLMSKPDGDYELNKNV